MTRIPISRAGIDGSGHVVRARIIVAGKLENLEAAFLELVEGYSIEVIVDRADWNLVEAAPGAEPSASKHMKPYARRLPVAERGGSRVRFIKVEEIDWIEAARQYLKLHVKSQSYLVRGRSLSMDHLASRLNPKHFMRVHRSHIVNLDRVEALHNEPPMKRYVVLASGQDVPISQTHWQALKAVLGGDGWE